MNRHRRDLPPILGALGVAILPHLGRLPAWIIAWCAVMWGYQLLSLRYRSALPGKWGRRLLTLGGLAGLALTYGQGFGPAAYLGLLAVMAAIKPFEMDTHRDRVVVVFLAYFIVITGLFQSESLLMTLYMLLSVGVTTAALVRINDPAGVYTDHLKLAARLVAQALPLVAILFLLFPRISGSFFGLSRLHTATTGFSETLAPGSVSRLAENDAVAFRVSFAEDTIPARPLYWRGVVFQHFDGRRWRISRQVPNLDAWTGGEAAVTYTISLEPHNRHWLFALELPAESPRWTRLRADFTLRTIRSVRRKYSYEMTSYRRYRTGDPRGLAAACRQLPETGNPAARRLARELAGEADTVAEKVQRVLAYLRDRNFVYTLRPPPLGSNPVDEFLTQTRQGYCEHYASAFAFLMRALDVPARVVGGYLGGETNPYGDYLLVRQNHAHVWVEVWQVERGWVRVDPTAAVAPERISGGGEGDAAAGSGDFSFGALARQLRLRWDAVSTAWEEWFTGYSHQEQRALLKRLGLNRPGGWRILVLAGLLVPLLVLAGALLLLVYFLPRRPRRTTDPVGRWYRKFCGKLARIGLARKPATGPRDFAAQVAAQRPDLAATVHRITDLYVQLRYAPAPDPAALARFKKAVRSFRPARPTPSTGTGSTGT